MTNVPARQADRLYHDLLSPQETQEVRARVRAVAEKVVAPPAAALRLDAGTTFPEPEAAMAKHYATRLSVDMARDAVQAFGGLGFARELGVDGTPGPVEAIYRDSKIGEIYVGTNEIQKWVIARQIFGRDITG